MIHHIPTSMTESWYRETVKLDGSEYVLTFAWNERERRWYMDMETIDGTAIAYGVKIVADAVLLKGVTNDLRPRGLLLSTDMTAEGVDPDIRDLGSRVKLFYIDEEDTV